MSTPPFLAVFTEDLPNFWLPPALERGVCVQPQRCWVWMIRLETQEVPEKTWPCFCPLQQSKLTYGNLPTWM